MQYNQRKRGEVVPHPPQFTPTFVLRKKLRFQAVAAATTPITILSLGDLWCVAATAVSAYQLASHIRLKKIEIWGPMSSTLVPVTVTIDWIGSTVGSFGKSNRVSDTSMGSTEAAHVKSAPPPGSQIAQWCAAAATNAICNVTYPIGAIIDISYEVVVRDDASVQAVNGAVAGATVGANYVRPLDSVTSGTNLPPVGYSSI